MPKRNVQKEPIAIVGIGCRFPGGSHSPQSFWEMLCEGKDAISEVPEDRWNVDAYYDPVPGKPGRSISKWGGFIEGIDRFDAGFFGISPREADWMDPQQRWLLEACAEALEDGGQMLDKLKGSMTGVFVGIATTDYSILQSTLIEHTKADVYSATGGSISIAANRISYCFDLNGPSISMDTACSSALTAVHVACQSLWKGDCSMALVAGVSALISPATFIAFSRMGMLSPDGRCKAFDASANGFVRGEGVGAIVLKPLSAAQSAGDTIYAVIRGTAANQDGRTNGLTLPSPIAQQKLVQAACRDAGISPAEVKYVEAHGTGTPVGDPIEAYALGTALGEGRSENDPCLVGSVKTNIGHLEAAAGIAGIIKAALVLKHGRIPPSLHFKNPNPHIDFAKLKLRVVQQIEPFPNGSGRMLAGINSFGFGGSNAHVILEAAPSPKIKKRKTVPTKASAQTAVLLPLSARSPEALQAVAKNYQALLSTAPGTNGNPPDVHAICRASAVRRTHHSHRLCAVGHSREELLENLAAFLAGEARPGLTVGQAATDAPAGPVFIFSGQGPQWWGMGRELMKQEPLFREKLEECDKLFKEFGGWSLLEELGRDEAESRLDQTAIAQPAIFALQIGLAALWQNWGIRPAAVIGHSVGEVAAAHLAGIYDLREAARIIFHRGRCMNAAPNGQMLAASLDMKQAKELVAGHGARIAVAAFNSPNSVTLSGEPVILEGIAQSLEQRGVFCRFLQVHYAFHSAQMDPIKTKLLQSLGEVKPNRAVLPFISTVAGRQMDGLQLTSDYWWRNVREPVHFDAAVDGLIQQGHRCFVEMSAHPALLLSISECLAHRSVAGVVLPSLRRQEKERATMLGSLGALHVAGVSVDWSALFPEEGPTVRLPQYPWQRERYWHEPEGHRGARLNRPDHPFMARSLRAATPGWVTWLDQELFPFLNDHRVQGHIVFPGAGYLETAFGVGRTLFGEVPLAVEDVDFQKALFLPENKEVVHLQTTYNPADLTIKFTSRAGATNEDWTVNAVAKLQAVPHATPPPAVNLEAVRKTTWTHEVEGQRIYAGYELIGLSYGPSFQGLETVWRQDGESLARVRLPENILKDASNHIIHPALLDACFQALTLAIPPNNPLEKRMLLPVFIDRVRFFGRPGPVVWCHTKLVSLGSRFATWNLQVLDETGRVLIDFEGFRSQAMAGSRAPRLDLPEEWLYDSRWDLKPLPGSEVSPEASTFLRDTSGIIKRVQQSGWRESAGRSRVSRQQKLEHGLNALARAYLLEAFAKLGCTSRSDRRTSTDSVLKKLKPPQSRAGILRRYLSMLEAQSDQPDSRRKASRAPRQPDAAALWIKLLHQFPAALAELTLIRRVGCALDKILRGEAEAGKIISPEGSLTVLEHLYQDSVSQRDSNHAMAEAVAAALENQPQDRVVRILEIGAGTGGLTAHVLPKLRSDRTDYVFSDKDENLVSKAEQKFFDYPFVRYQRLDVGKDLAGQDFDGQSFDLIVACDTVCFTSDVRKAVGQIRRLLAPGGLLVLAERVRVPAWFGFVFGLEEGWGNLSDSDSRSDHPFFNREQWIKVLTEAGFEKPVAANVPGTLEIFLARAPEAVPLSAATATEPEKNLAPGAWLIFADSTGIGEQLAGLLRAQAAHAMLVFAGSKFERLGTDRFEIGASSMADMQTLLAEVNRANGKSLTGVVHLWSLDADSPADLNATSLLEAERIGCHSILHIVQSLSQGSALQATRLWLVTRGAQPVHDGEKVSCAQTPVCGIGRTIMSEYHNLSCRLIDLSPGGDDTEARSLLKEVLSDSPESEVAYRGAARLVNRVTRSSLELHVPRRNSHSREIGYRLEIPSPGVMDQLAFREVRRRKPGPGEVEIEVCAAALNFRDVMKAMGIYPSESELDLLPGDECAGRIVAVGKSVRGLKPGDEVIATGAGCFASHITVPAMTVFRKPARISFEEAVTIPVTFMTAWYALHDLGRIRKGERILVQAGTGGVGLAAIQIAQLAGAEVFATAGNPEKRDFLRALGVRHVMDSRSLAFADEIRAITRGKGVDLVLNSLAGLAIAKGLACLSPGGRFLEIGKRDIYQNTSIGLRPFRNNVSMFVIDLGQIMQGDPAYIQRLLKPIMAHFRSGRLHPLPHRTLSVSRIVSAFRLMAQARHVGKIVVSMENSAVSPARVPSKKPARFSAKASYLITGGLGGFGLAVAKWMIECGARSLVLTGRSGAATPETKRTVAGLRRLGAKVAVLKADVTSATDVARVFNTIKRRFPPLRGILHTAMVLDDGILAQLTADRFSKVMAPKVSGAWNLHLASSGLPLDFFVLFSSVSSFVGAAGQGNYVAANSFLDGLAHYRRAIGLPAIAINWGAISEVGFLARNTKVQQHLASHGVLGITPAQATEMLGRLLQSNCSQIGFMRVDWQKFAESPSSSFKSPRYSEVVHFANKDSAEGRGQLRAALLAAPASERQALAVNQVRDIVAKVLRTSPSKLDPQRPLKETGLDSLMAVELLTRLESEFAISLPPGKLGAGGTISTIATVVLETLTGAADKPSDTDTPREKQGTPPQVVVNDGPLSECLLTLRAGGSRPPLFCIHPGGGLANVYEPLAECLSDELPVYGIQSRAYQDERGERDSAEALARDYASLIIERQPSGPCHLAGFSVGGLFALATAGELERRGRSVAFVGLIDTQLHLLDPDCPREAALQRQIIEMYNYFAAEMALRPLAFPELSAQAAGLARKVLAAAREEQLQITMGWLADQGLMLSNDSASVVKQYLSLFITHSKQANEIVLSPVCAPVWHWRAADTQDDSSLPAPASNRFTSVGVFEETIDGGHYALMQRPGVEALATSMEAALQAATNSRMPSDVEPAVK